jgi:hypothetical protein
MTVLAPSKYRTLATLLQQLARPIATGRLAVAQRWRDDERAVGFYKPGEPELAAYVFTHGQALGRYGVHLEYPALDANDASNAPTVAEDIGLEHLLDLLDMHFGLYGPFGTER